MAAKKKVEVLATAAAGDAELGTRERRRRESMARVQEVALAAFEAGTKERIVLWDDYDPALLELVLRPETLSLKELYVAITRGANSLTVVSKDRVIRSTSAQ